MVLILNSDGNGDVSLLFRHMNCFLLLEVVSYCFSTFRSRNIWRKSVLTQKSNALFTLLDARMRYHSCLYARNTGSIELCRERLSEKVHASIPKGIEFTVLRRNLKEWY